MVWITGDGAFIVKSRVRKSCRCCSWQIPGRSDLVAAAVGGRTAVLPLLSFSFVSKFYRWFLIVTIGKLSVQQRCSMKTKS